MCVCICFGWFKHICEETAFWIFLGSSKFLHLQWNDQKSYTKQSQWWFTIGELLKKRIKLSCINYDL